MRVLTHIGRSPIQPAATSGTSVAPQLLYAAAPRACEYTRHGRGRPCHEIDPLTYHFSLSTRNWMIEKMAMMTKSIQLIADA